MSEPNSGTVYAASSQSPHPSDPSLSFDPPAAFEPRHATPPTGQITADDRTWAIGAHLSGFAAAYVALGLLGPLVVMLTGGSRSAYVRRHAVEALNFNISVLLWLALSGLLTIVLIGFPMLLAVGILYVVASIRGALAASRGEEYSYPLTVRFVS